MAEEKTVMKAKESFFDKVKKFFRQLPKKIARPFKNMWHELKKVTWPQRSELINYSLVVLGFMIVMGVVIFVIDAGAGALVQWITR